ncbi:hypothetical protein D3C74_391900 [compost metagenome]
METLHNLLHLAHRTDNAVYAAQPVNNALDLLHIGEITKIAKSPEQSAGFGGGGFGNGDGQCRFCSGFRSCGGQHSGFPVQGRLGI